MIDQTLKEYSYTSAQPKLAALEILPFSLLSVHRSTTNNRERGGWVYSEVEEPWSTSMVAQNDRQVHQCLTSRTIKPGIHVIMSMGLLAR
jgi:hypothetical protein